MFKNAIAKFKALVIATFFLWPLSAVSDSRIPHGRVEYKLSRCARTLLTKERYAFGDKQCPITIKMRNRRYRATIGSLKKPFVQNTFIRKLDGSQIKHERSYALFRGDIKRGPKVLRASGKGRRYRLAASIIETEGKITIDFSTPRYMYQSRAPLKRILDGKAVRLFRIPRVLHGLSCPVANTSSLSVTSISTTPPTLPAVPSERSVVFTRADYDDFTASSKSDPEGYVAGVMNSVSTIYLDQLGMDINVFAIVGIGNVLGSTTNPIDLIDSYSAFRKGISTSSVLQHLITTRTLDAPVIGIAFQGQVCIQSDFSVGLSSEVTFNGANVQHLVAAHEIGHNFNATHDDNSVNLMSSVLTGSDQFSSQGITEIESFVAGAGGSCLAASGATPPTGDDDDDNGGDDDDDDDNGGGSGGGGGGRPGDNDNSNAGVRLRVKAQVVGKKNNTRQSVSLFLKYFGHSKNIKNCGKLMQVGLYAATKRGALKDVNDLSKATLLNILDLSSVPEGIFTRIRAKAKLARSGKDRFFVRAVTSCVDENNASFKAASEILPVKLIASKKGSTTAKAVISKIASKFASQ